MFQFSFRISLRFVAITLLLSSFKSPVQAAIVYNLTPFSLSRGYEFAGGTITTDGSVGGDFDRNSILDYDFNITGPLNFTFRPSNPGARVFGIPEELVVTESEIYFPSLALGETGTLTIESRVQIDPEAQIFVQQVQWTQGSNLRISSVAFINQSFGANIRQPSNGQGSNSQPMLNKFVIATSVPEPSSFMMLGFVIVGLSNRRRRY